VARGLPRTLLAIATRPRLWGTALRVARRTAAPRWWAVRPFLPLPPADYVRFRMVTQYGDERHAVVPGDVLNYLAWCRIQHRLAGGG
jgi:hypothetical protein